MGQVEERVSKNTMKGIPSETIVKNIRADLAADLYRTARFVLGALGYSEYVTIVAMQDRCRIIDSRAGMTFDFVPVNGTSGSDLLRAGMHAATRAEQITEQHEKAAVAAKIAPVEGSSLVDPEPHQASPSF